ncbi:hypothetical protein C4580_02035 [Candidatus Woesearchaeota archaeon]|nr:MAG: hypothetical protein C4580_02035 [Candidatus Woesearchaeota archaeon]
MMWFEVMAFVIAALVVVKLAVVLTNPRKWMVVVRAVYGNPRVSQVVAAVLAAASLWYLLKIMSIVHIFAVLFFLSMVMVVGACAYGRELVSFAERMLKEKDIVQRSWLAIVIWLALSLWALWQIFAA